MGRFDGGTWTWSGTITNDGVNSGNHTYEFDVPEGTELELLYGHAFNGDSSGRSLDVRIRESDNDRVFGYILPPGLTIGVNAVRPFPTAEVSADDSGMGPADLKVSGTMHIYIRIASVAVSQDTRVAIVCRLKTSAVPTVTLTSPTDATENEQVNETR